MRQRVISALVATLLLIPIVLIGGNIYKIGVFLLGFLAMYELIKAKDNVKKTPLFVKIIIYYCFFVGLFNNFFNETFNVVISSNYIILTIFSLLSCLILYRDENKFNIMDATYLLFINLFLIIGFSLLMSIRIFNIYYLIMILLITISSDTFALITGSLIGKRKFCESVSPLKTVEGFIGGLVFCLIICVPSWITIFNYNGNIFLLILFIGFLSVISTIGDLVFSFIKRCFNIKDYGKIMPGHGGVMDRLDSFMFVLIIFYILISYL